MNIWEDITQHQDSNSHNIFFLGRLFEQNKIYTSMISDQIFHPLHKLSRLRSRIISRIFKYSNIKFKINRGSLFPMIK